MSATRIEEAKSLHPAFYVDEAYLQAERERIFGTSWFAAAHTAELSSPGDVKVVEVGGTSIVLTCDKHRRIHAFYNVCRHRGARVCTTAAKGCKQLVCPYHWWAYRLDGSLKSTPPAATPKDRKETLGLQRVPGLEVFAGMVFLNQNPSHRPLRDQLGDLPAKLERYDLDGLELHDVRDYAIRGDWKLIAENFVDFYHINAVHPELARFSKVDDHLPYQGRGQYIGFVTAPLTDSGGPGDSHHFNRFERLSNVESEAAFFFQVFPNVSVTVYPHSVYTLMTFPTTEPGKTQEKLTLLMAPGAKKSADPADLYHEKCSNLMKFVTNINDEDVEAIENLQVGLYNARDQGIHGEFIPKYDWTVHRFQNMVLNGLHGSPIDETYMPTLDTAFEQRVLQGLS
uniref:Choline monooxygenase, chloroplastic n=1 Tax=Zooxanthella nutricula TaxID=1333877 RepID=A0A7S2QJD1_9DINO